MYFSAMIQLLHQYLAQRGELPLAGMGLLKYRHEPAVYDVTQQQMEPPVWSLVFEHGHDAALQPVVAFWARHSGTTEEDAWDDYHGYCSWIKEQLGRHGNVNLAGIGRFVLGAERLVSFEADASPAIFGQLPAVRITQQGRHYQVLVGEKETDANAMTMQLEEQAAFEEIEKDRWWLWPAILAIAVAAVIALKLTRVI
jgi:hypothetical protein